MVSLSLPPVPSSPCVGHRMLEKKNDFACTTSVCLCLFSGSQQLLFSTYSVHAVNTFFIHFQNISNKSVQVCKWLVHFFFHFFSHFRGHSTRLTFSKQDPHNNIHRSPSFFFTNFGLQITIIVKTKVESAREIFICS